METLRRLSSLDAAFLALDSGHSVGHVCLVAVLDGDVRLGDLRSAVAGRLSTVPLLTQRLHVPTLGLGGPYWQHDPDFDLDAHLHERRLRHPGGPRQLGHAVERIIEPVLDRERPLWQLHLLRGLQERRTALITKVHHAAVDGIAGRELLTALLEDERVVTPVRVEPSPARGAVDMVADVLGRVMALPIRLVRLEAKALGKVPDLSAFAVSSAARLSSRSVEWLSGGDPDSDGLVVSSPGIAAPPTPFNKAISSNRSWAFGRLSLEDSRPLRQALGASVNDVFLAATAGALRRWLIDQDALPREPLRAMVPVSVRTSEEIGAYGNRLALMLCALPTHEADPVERLHLVHQATQVAKEHHAIDAKRLQDITRFAVPALTTRAAAVAARVRLADYVRLPLNLVVSNVPGTRDPVQLVGRELQALYPVPPISDGLGLNVTVQGYRNYLHAGLTASPELIGDLWQLMAHLQDAYQELVDASPGQ